MLQTACSRDFIFLKETVSLSKNELVCGASLQENSPFFFKK